MDIVVMAALGLMVIIALTQIAAGGVYLLLGQDGADKRKGVKRLAMGGALILLLVLLAGLPACAPLSPAGQANSSQVDPDTVRSVPMPSWAWPVEQWLNMDWDLWSCPRARGC